MSDPQHADMLAAWNEPRHGANQCQHGQLARVCLTCEHDAEIERLTRELANARAADIHSCGPTCKRAGCVNGRLREQVAALEVDALRYRWLRSHVSGHRAVSSARPATFAFPGPMVLTPLGDIMRGSVAQHLDAGIDAALAAQKGARLWTGCASMASGCRRARRLASTGHLGGLGCNPFGKIICVRAENSCKKGLTMTFR